FGIPNLHGPLSVRNGEAFAVGAERHVIDVHRGAREGTHFLPCFCVPESGRLIIPARSEPFAIGTERQAPDARFVGRERTALPASFAVPNFDVPVQTARGQEPAVGAKGHAQNRTPLVQGGWIPEAQPLEVVPFPTA